MFTDWGKKNTLLNKKSTKSDLETFRLTYDWIKNAISELKQQKYLENNHFSVERFICLQKRPIQMIGIWICIISGESYMHFFKANQKQN